MDVDGRMGMTGDMNMSGNMTMTGDMSTSMRTDNTASKLISVPVNSPSTTSASSKICIVDVDGMLVNKNMSGMGSMGENPVALFREKLDFIASDSTICAVVLRINSNGGGVTAADVMSRDLEQLMARRRIPVVACVMDVGAGGAYYLACGANRIVAHPTSLVGGIGVIANVYNLEDLMGQFGIAAIPVKQGDLVDMGTATRSMQQEERDLLEGIAKRFHERFIERVRQRRSIAAPDHELFDGRIFTGDQALTVHLVDHVGYLDDAIADAQSLAGLSDTCSTVMLRRDNDRAYSLMDVTPNTPTLSSIIPLKVPGLDRGNLPTFLYLWQPE